MRVGFKIDVIGWEFEGGTPAALLGCAWYPIGSGIARKTQAGARLPRHFLCVASSNQKMTKIRGNGHDEPGRSLSRPSLQHRKTLRKQDARRYRRAPVRIQRRAGAGRRCDGLYDAPAGCEMGPRVSRARVDRSALRQAGL